MRENCSFPQRSGTRTLVLSNSWDFNPRIGHSGSPFVFSAGFAAPNSGTVTTNPKLRKIDRGNWSACSLGIVVSVPELPGQVIAQIAGRAKLRGHNLLVQNAESRLFKKRFVGAGQAHMSPPVHAAEKVVHGMSGKIGRVERDNPGQRVRSLSETLD